MLTHYNPGNELSAAIDPSLMLLYSGHDVQPYNPIPPAPPAKPASSTSMLPWLLGAGVLAYLVFFRKKKTP